MRSAIRMRQTTRLAFGSIRDHPMYLCIDEGRMIPTSTHVGVSESQNGVHARNSIFPIHTRFRETESIQERLYLWSKVTPLWRTQCWDAYPYRFVRLRILLIKHVFYCMQKPPRRQFVSVSCYVDRNMLRGVYDVGGYSAC